MNSTATDATSATMSPAARARARTAAKGRSRRKQTPPSESAVKPRRHRELPIPLELPAAALLRAEQVLMYIPVCRAAWFKGVKQGIYPQPKHFGKHRLWHTRDIAALMEHGPRQLRGAKAKAN
jgi:hypothetical protein